MHFLTPMIFQAPGFFSGVVKSDLIFIIAMVVAIIILSSILLYIYSFEGLLLLLIPSVLILSFLYIDYEKRIESGHNLNIGNSEYVNSFGNYTLTPDAISLLKKIYYTENRTSVAVDAISDLSSISVNQYNTLVDQKLTTKNMDIVFHADDINQPLPLFLISKMSYHNGNADIYGFMSELYFSYSNIKNSFFDISFCHLYNDNNTNNTYNECMGLKHYHLTIPVTPKEYMKIHSIVEIQRFLLGQEVINVNDSLPLKTEPMKLLNINILPESKLYVSDNIHIIDAMTDTNSQWYANGAYFDIMDKLLVKDFSINKISDKDALLNNTDYLYIHDIKSLKDHKYQINLNRLPAGSTTYGPHYLYSITTTLSDNDAKALAQLETLQHSLFQKYDEEQGNTPPTETQSYNNGSVIIINNNVVCSGDNCSTDTNEEDNQQDNTCTPQEDSDNSDSE